MDKPLSLFTKLLLIGAGGLAVVAGPVLFLFPFDTTSYFAWTIRHPLTPVFMGANYFGGIGAIWAVLSNRWSVARVLVPGIFVFAITQLAATVLNIAIFNWQHPIAWAWLFVYISSPVAAFLVYLQMSKGYEVPAEFPQSPLLLRRAMLLCALINGVLGVALWLSPAVFGSTPGGAVPWWAWTLTPLTAQVVGGWYLAAAALYWTLSQPQTQQAVRIGVFGSLCATGLELLGAVLHAGQFNGNPMMTAIYLLNAGTVFLLAGYVILRSGTRATAGKVA